MAFFLFVDESGQDRGASPYEVLAGVAIADADLWNLVCSIQDAEELAFGLRYSQGSRELKARALLKTKTFRLAASRPPFDPERRRALARSCLADGAVAGGAELAALGQAKLAFVGDVVELLARFRCTPFASIVDPRAARSGRDFLRKDYAYLFERFFYFLEDQPGEQQGLVVFDELERSRSHVLADQMRRYFRETKTGRRRAARVIPEPVFVHSDLTTGIQLADLVAYLISWNVRVHSMTEPSRSELDPFGSALVSLRYRTTRQDQSGTEYTSWSFAVIDDLRPRDERELD